jgi:transposase, IS30 family
MGTYTQLTQEERYQIHAPMKADHSQTDIASVPGRDKSTISREFKRNQGQQGYQPEQAQELADRRRQTAHHDMISTTHWDRVDNYPDRGEPLPMPGLSPDQMRQAKPPERS